MFNFLTEKRFKKIAKWSILSMLFFQAFPMLYFGYDLSHPLTRNLWTIGLAFPAVISIIGIIKPELVAKAMLEEEKDKPDVLNRRGRRFAILTLILFVAAMVLIQAS